MIKMIAFFSFVFALSLQGAVALQGNTDGDSGDSRLENPKKLVPQKNTQESE